MLNLGLIDRERWSDKTRPLLFQHALARQPAPYTALQESLRCGWRPNSRSTRLATGLLPIISSLTWPLASGPACESGPRPVHSSAARKARTIEILNGAFCTNR